jgi:thiol-disulfide isomerase/thioredoxin
MVSVQMTVLALALAGGGETVLLDFHAPWCAPCRAMEGTVAELERAGYPVRRVNIEQHRQLAAQYRVQTIPCFVLLVDGREAGRMSGAVSRRELEGLLAHSGVRGGGRSSATALAATRGGGLAALPRRPIETGARDPAPNGQELIGSSVRLTISDPGGVSHGSGTIIDARGGEALVLTCGHIFRDSQGKGQITVDLCGPAAPQDLPGKLVRYDCTTNDIGLVSIRPGVPVRAAPIAPREYQVSKGDPVITVGCNGGGPATAQNSTITSINKFLGPANLQVAGLPVQGRSGGGLFNAAGQVIGVCNAADPADNEGLYAALSVIHEEIDKAGLSAVFAQSATALASTPMPGPAPVVPAGMNSTAALGSATPAALGGVPDGAEVICIVRSHNDPHAKSEVIRLDRASPAFLQQLAVDREAQATRHLTSLDVRPPAATPQPRTRR